MRGGDLDLEVSGVGSHCRGEMMCRSAQLDSNEGMQFFSATFPDVNGWSIRAHRAVLRMLARPRPGVHTWPAGVVWTCFGRAHPAPMNCFWIMRTWHCIVVASTSKWRSLWPMQSVQSSRGCGPDLVESLADGLET